MITQSPHLLTSNQHKTKFPVYSNYAPRMSPVLARLFHYYKGGKIFFGVIQWSVKPITYLCAPMEVGSFWCKILFYHHPIFHYYEIYHI